MPSLKLQKADGSTEVRELSRSHPLTIGRQSFNDICVPENDVGPLHCRVSWNKRSFEVTAATSGGVDFNTTTVTHAELKPGDVIRVGSLDLIFHDETAVKKAVVSPPPPSPQPASSAVAAPAGESSSGRKHRQKPEPAEKPVEDLSLFDGEIKTESQAMMDAMFEDLSLENDSAFLEGQKDNKDNKDKEDNTDKKDSKDKKPVPAVATRQLRPGEQEILKSPLVLGLTFGGLTLLLITAVFWFLISRDQSNRQYDRAVKEMNDGQFAQATASFEKFIQDNPKHGLRRLAERGLAKTLILKEISGAAPAWKRGLDRLNELIKANRNESDFSELYPALYQFADQISLGSAKSAESNRDPELLVVSKDAQTLLERYADPAVSPSAAIGRINDQRVKADRAIEKQKTFDLAMKVVDAAIANQQPMTALSERERLVKLFPDFVSSKRVKDALQKALDLERSVVTTDETDRIAETNDEAPPSKEPILGVLLARSRSDEASQGRVVFVVAKDSCYAIDATTGELIWRRVIGPDTPFFPVVTNGAQPAVLLFDARKKALLCCQLAKGKLIWQQPLKARAIGQPLVHEGQIYLSLEGKSLVRIEVDTGRLSAKVKFSQDLATSPVLSRDGEYLLVPGQMAMIYSLAVRSKASQPALSAVATTFTDHGAGSISAPPLPMGQLLLLCENDRANSARLRLWDARNPASALPELSSTRMEEGQVRDAPVLRGNHLVVPSDGEQFGAFVVTDEAGAAGIAPIGQYRAIQPGDKGQVQAPLFVALGPDGQFWSAGSAFRRFEISSNKITMDSNSTAPGIASQPLQRDGEYFFVGRKSRVSDAVTFSAIDREKLVNPWRCIVGDSPLELLPTRDGGVVWVGESGTLYNIGTNRLNQGGIEMKAGTDLDLPANLTKRIRATALHDQRLVVFAAGDTSQLFVLNPNGQVTGKIAVKDFPEADPVLLDDGLVVPLSGRLKVVPLSSGKKATQDWISPVGETLEHHWSHLIRIDGSELIACDETGRLGRVQLRQGDVPHLAEVAKLQLEQPVDVRPVLRGENLFVADAGGTCRQLNISSFDTEGKTSLPAPIKNLWTVGMTTVVQANDGKLHCLADGKELPESWNFDLKGLNPTGPIVLKDDQAWLACREGTVIVLNAMTGAEVRRIVVPQSLSLGLRPLGDGVIAVGSDGTLYRL